MINEIELKFKKKYELKCRADTKFQAINRVLIEVFVECSKLGKHQNM
jgi:hypothetical protein